MYKQQISKKKIVELYRIGNEVLFFSKDSSRRSYFIQLFNMDESRMIWEQEIYFEFYAKRPLADVITFESDESMVALYFAGTVYIVE